LKKCNKKDHVLILMRVRLMIARWKSYFSV